LESGIFIYCFLFSYICSSHFYFLLLLQLLLLLFPDDESSHPRFILMTFPMTVILAVKILVAVVAEVSAVVFCGCCGC